jgi:hypothetical protein
MGGPRQGFRGAFPEQRPYGAPLGTHLGHAQRGRSFARDHHQVDAVGQELGKRPEALAAEALHAVAKHGPAHATRDHEAHARRPRRGRLSCHEEGEVRRPHAAARTLRTYELGVLPESPLGRSRGCAGGAPRFERARHPVVQPVYFL